MIRGDRRAEASGKFVLRIDAALHAALRESAGATGLSLNEFCARKLALPCGSVSSPALEVVGRAAQITHSKLIGVVAFGSWSRDELADTSDVDILIVVEDTLPIDRSLYRAWDTAPVAWGGHAIEPHFVHLPPPDRHLSGVWAEVAVEGIVLFERGLVVSRRLVEIRRRVASGEIVRRVAHGQHYWVEVA